MHKARKDIIKAMDAIDLLIEIVDARLPFSSQNPVIGRWRAEKPTLVIFSKTDLADPVLTDQWQAFFEQQSNTKTLAYHMGDKARLKQIPELCLKLVPEKPAVFERLHGMILGIPNVGKSTLINALTGKAIAKTGDEPAVTKHQQKFVLNDQITLHDTPGILWPKIENLNSGYRLAIMGSIKNTAIDYEDIAFHAVEYLLKAYPERLQERYKLTSLPDSELECLELIGYQRGAKQAGGRINLHKAAEVLIHDMRSGQLGPLTLESPDMITDELNTLAQAKEIAEQQSSAKERPRKRNG